MRAASGVVNVAHQLGGSLGLGALIALAATPGTNPDGADATLAQHVATALTAGTCPGPAERLTETELIEAITHLALYAGWPIAMSAITMAKQVIGD